MISAIILENCMPKYDELVNARKNLESFYLWNTGLETQFSKSIYEILCAVRNGDPYKILDDKISRDLALMCFTSYPLIR